MVLTHLTMLGVVLASVCSLALGALWYSSYLFGPLWQKLAGISSANMQARVQETMFLCIGNVFVGCILMGILLSFIHPSSVMEGVFFSFLCWLGFVPYLANQWIFERKAPALVALSAAYTLCSMLLTAAVMTLLA